GGGAHNKWALPLSIAGLVLRQRRGEGMALAISGERAGEIALHLKYFADPEIAKGESVLPLSIAGLLLRQRRGDGMALAISGERAGEIALHLKYFADLYVDDPQIELQSEAVPIGGPLVLQDVMGLFYRGECLRGVPLSQARCRCLD